MQLLWLNLLTDVWPAIALASEPPETDVMRLPPRDTSQPIVGKNELERYAREGTIIAGGSLAAYFYGTIRYGATARSSTIAFNALILGQLLHALSCRSDRYGVFSRGGRGRNRELELAIRVSLGLQVAANVVPGLRRLLGIAPMTAMDLLVTLAGAGVPLLVNDTAKARITGQSAKAASALTRNPR
jgi:Ca2+-transporting ATPase